MILETVGILAGTAAVTTPGLILLASTRKEMKKAKNSQRMAELEMHLALTTRPIPVISLTNLPMKEEAMTPGTLEPMEKLAPSLHPAIQAAMLVPPGQARMKAMDQAMKVIAREGLESGTLTMDQYQRAVGIPPLTEPSKGLMQVTRPTWNLNKETVEALTLRRRQMESMFQTPPKPIQLPTRQTLAVMEKPKDLTLDRIGTAMHQMMETYNQTDTATAEMPYAGPPTMELKPIRVDWDEEIHPTNPRIKMPQTKPVISPPTISEISSEMVLWIRTGKRPSKRVREVIAATPVYPTQQTANEKMERLATNEEIHRKVSMKARLRWLRIKATSSSTMGLTQLGLMQVSRAPATSRPQPFPKPTQRLGKGQVSVEMLGAELNGRWHRGQHHL